MTALERLAEMGWRPVLRDGRMYMDGAPESVRSFAREHRAEILDALLFVPGDDLELQTWATDRLRQLAKDLFAFMWRADDEGRFERRPDHARVLRELERREAAR